MSRPLLVTCVRGNDHGSWVTKDDPFPSLIGTTSATVECRPRCRTCRLWMLLIADAVLRRNTRGSVTLVNGSALFSCCTNTSLPIHWHYLLPQDNKVFVVYNGQSLHPGLLSSFSVTFEPSSSCSDLRISRVQLSDAGTYRCLESTAERRKLYLDLVVFGQYQLRIRGIA